MPRFSETYETAGVQHKWAYELGKMAMLVMLVDDGRVARSISIESVDRELTNGFRTLRFSPLLEQAYEADRSVDRLRYAIFCMILGIIVYDAFLFSDWQMVPDVFWECCIYRLGIFTPLAIAVCLIVKCFHRQPVREGLWSVMGIVGVILMMKTVVDSDSHYVTSYSYGTVLVMIYSIVVQRAPIRYAIASTVVIVAAQIVGVKSSSRFDSEMFVANVAFFGAAAVLLLWIAYVLEREGRQNYLLTKRSCLLNEQLELTTKVDPLTGLWNRRYLNAAMSTAWAQTVALPMAVIILDIDQFKLFNDTYGHMAGDVCLQRVATALSRTLDEREGFAIRFGGEEFLIFLPGHDERAATAVAERLRTAVHREAIPYQILGPRAVVTASFGIASAPASAVPPMNLIAAADQALYRAKSDGRDCIRAAIEPERLRSPSSAIL